MTAEAKSCLKNNNKNIFLEDQDKDVNAKDSYQNFTVKNKDFTLELLRTNNTTDTLY